MKILIVITSLLLLLPIVYAVDTNECNIDIQNYATLAKDFVNSNQEDQNIKYAQRFLGKNLKIEIKIDNDFWHAIMVDGKIIDISPGVVEKEDYNVYTSICTLYELENNILDPKKAVEDGKITYTANGFFNKLRLRILKMFIN